MRECIEDMVTGPERGLLSADSKGTPFLPNYRLPKFLSSLLFFKKLCYGEDRDPISKLKIMSQRGRHYVSRYHKLKPLK